jgi:DNA polymerase III subunit gamma/tau
MEYRVLARKYRPTNFDDLIGQDVLVQTLSNAIKSGRIAHAFLLTGIRGVGKTTTARIIARALNCIGSDGAGGPTISPCGVCSNCTMISQDRHVDILEMDAASHTGVGDIRDLIDTVRYLPTSARYKVYIIDEVHMLSNSAFNALLKTLEEPPPHVKFIFATTEARKIPVTILSRCQRFDLKRIEMEMLASHLNKIAGKENIGIEEDALKLIAVAAEGSVRDALSLLDQAIARAVESDGKTLVTAASVRQMIGSADNTATFRLLEKLLAGDVAAAIAEVRSQYNAGSDPMLMVQDSLEVTHLVTRVKVAPMALSDVSLSEHDRTEAKSMADRLSMPVLTRLWQMLLKGVSEVRMAPSPLSALEMLMVRIAYAAQLPTPAEIIRGGVEPAARSSPSATAEKTSAASKPNLELVSAKPESPAAAVQPSDVPPASIQVTNFEEVVALFEQNREGLKSAQLKRDVRLVRFEPGIITIQVNPNLPRDFAAQVGACLTKWTGQAWKVVLSEDAGNASLHEQELVRKEQQIQEVSTHPLVNSVLEQFPGAKLVGVKSNS